MSLFDSGHFGVCFRSLLFFECFYCDYVVVNCDLLLRWKPYLYKNTWWKQNVEEKIFYKPEGRKQKQLKLEHTAHARLCQANL